MMRESPVLKACKDYLQFQQNLGKLMFLRLNSGSLFPVNKASGKSYRVQLCPEGTADIMFIRGCYLGRGNIVYTHIDKVITRVFFVETKSTKGKLSPAQEEFKALVTAQGAEYLLVRDVDEMIRVLE